MNAYPSVYEDNLKTPEEREEVHEIMHNYLQTSENTGTKRRRIGLDTYEVLLNALVFVAQKPAEAEAVNALALQ